MHATLEAGGYTGTCMKKTDASALQTYHSQEVANTPKVAHITLNHIPPPYSNPV